VPALFEVQRYSSVLQMTSTVHRANCATGATLGEIFAALYPCGSITGAPKRRTMEIIRELEPDPRGVYTGAIGWFDPPQGWQQRQGRRLLHVGADPHAGAAGAGCGGVRRGEMGVGAGIVFDSDPQEEYAECQLKARFLTGLPNDFEIFETMHATPRRTACATASATWRAWLRLGGLLRLLIRRGSGQRPGRPPAPRWRRKIRIACAWRCAGSAHSRCSTRR
jgi:hypothetical protein